MSQSIFSGDFADLSLGQLGASKIKTVNGQQHVVHFDLGEGKELVYVFSVTNENRCYLQPNSWQEWFHYCHCSEP